MRIKYVHEYVTTYKYFDYIPKIIIFIFGSYTTSIRIVF